MPALEGSFLKDLKNMDRRLGVKFNGKHFIVVYERPYGEPANIHCVRTADGDFRQPDQRDLCFIKSGDLENDRLKERLDKLARYCEEERTKTRKKDKEEIKAMTRDSKNQLKNAFAKANNLGKAKHVFRQVEPKRKGKTIEEIRGEA